MKTFLLVPVLVLSLAWPAFAQLPARPSAFKPPEIPPESVPLAHFLFNGNGLDEIPGNPDFELRNTEFRDNALYLNGSYGIRKDDGSNRAVCRTSALNYNQFTVALRFKADEFAAKQINVFSGGTSYRWFGMLRSPSGNLTVTLNNGKFSHEIKSAPLAPGKWTVVVCGVDLTAGKIVVYLNGRKTAPISLPPGFKLEVADSPAKMSDKVWSFTNYSNGTTFHGLVDECIIYGEMLSDEKMAKIPLQL